MANQKERIFADGFRFTQPRESAPDYVIGRVSIKVDEAIAFLRANEKKGWVNLDVMLGRSGSPYMELDQYEPKKDTGNENNVRNQPSRGTGRTAKAETKPEPEPEDEASDDLPF